MIWFSWRQWETMADKGEIREGRHAITGTRVGRQWETMVSMRERRGEKGTEGERRGDQTLVWEGGHTIQHRHTCGETTGDKWRQGTGKADTPTNKKETRRETLGGRQRETRPRRTPEECDKNP